MIDLGSIVLRIIERIKKAGEWDGSASNYDTPEEYCAACLIDVSGSEKCKTHCKLPVKLPGGDEMVWEGVTAAAAAIGGARAEMKKPEGVSDSDWESAMKGAANEIISAYNEMDETAPDSVYETAGKSPPGDKEERDIEFHQVAAQLDEQFSIQNSGGYLHGMYQGNDGMYAIFSESGKLYRVDYTYSNGEITLGKKQEVVHSFSPVTTRVIRQKDGRYRFLTRSATSVLNRVGEIDSRQLLQDLAKNFEKAEFEVLRVIAHEGESYRTGIVDTVIADGNQLILSGLYDEDNLLADLEVKARQKNPDQWGDSIGYNPLEWGAEEIGGTNILVMKRGVLVEVSTLLEKHAANLFTSGGKIIRRKEMKRSTLEALLQLAEGDEDMLREALQFAGEHDEVEALIEQSRLITRETEEEDVETEADDAETETVIEVSDEIIREVIGSEEITRMQEALSDSAEALGELVATVEGLASRIEDLEADDETRLRELLQDAPEAPRAIRIVRARQRAAEDVGAGDGEEDDGELAPEQMVKNALVKAKKSRQWRE